MSKKLYGVYKGDELVYTGPSREVSKFLGLGQNGIYNYAKNKQCYQKRYYLKFLGEYVPEPEPPKETKAEKERREHLENIIAMLKLHGSTFVKDIDEWRKDLRANNIKYRAIPWENGYRVERR